MDKKFENILMGAISDYASGNRPWTGVGFDLMRMSEDGGSMEPVFLLLMSEQDWKTISLMMRVLHNPEGDVRNEVYDAILSVLRKHGIGESE